MKSFFKNIASSCLGTLLALFVLVLLGIITVKAIISSQNSNQKGILHLPLTGLINDFGSPGFDITSLNFATSSSLWDIRKKVDAAATDDAISGLFLEFENVELSQQMASELAQIIGDFRKTGKKVYSYSNYYNQNAYYLSTYSDSIFVNPNGGVDLKGYAIYSPFFKKILDRYDVDINIYFAGKYKSATEPYRLDAFSEANKLQLRAYLAELYRKLEDVIKQNRGIEKDILADIIASQRIYDAQYMSTQKVVDQVLYRDEVISFLEDRFDNADLVPLSKYTIGSKKVDNETVIVFAAGEITWGNTGSGGITPAVYSQIFKTIREDKKIKKVILRIDSPGGNGYVSDVLHREVELTKESGKKVYASFGSYATSGAYYIASACDSIFATENTMTGSIGVYIMLPTFDRLLEKQFEIKVDTILSNGAALSYTPLLAIPEDQAEMLKGQTERLYQQFLEKVSKGRDLSVDQVHKIAQGRIWTGADAKEIGLVDELITLDNLIEKVSINGNPRVFPEVTSSFPESLLKDGLGKFDFLQNSQLSAVQTKLIEFQKLIENPSPRMRLPLSINVTNQ